MAHASMMLSDLLCPQNTFKQDRFSIRDQNMEEEPVKKVLNGSPDKIKLLYPMVDENETPLPRQWSSKKYEKCATLGLANNDLRVFYKGTGKDLKDAASIRTTHAIPVTCGIYYFEVKVITKGREGYMGIGVTAVPKMENRLPGWDKFSFGYHGDDGNSFCSSGQGQPYGPTFTTGDVIGCCVNFIDNTCFYTLNGNHLGVAFRDLPTTLYPTVGLQTPGEMVEANFGQFPFVFNFEDYLKEWKKKMTSRVINFVSLSYKGDVQADLQKMVSSYLVHQGYSLTAEAFAQATGQSIQEDITSVKHRQKIQRFVLAGRISEAISLTQKLYPSLLDKNHDLLFKLKCRQFIEMVNGTDDDYTASPSSSSSSSSSHYFHHHLSSPTPSSSASPSYDPHHHHHHHSKFLKSPQNGTTPKNMATTTTTTHSTTSSSSSSSSSTSTMSMQQHVATNGTFNNNNDNSNKLTNQTNGHMTSATNNNNIDDDDDDINMDTSESTNDEDDDDDDVDVNNVANGNSHQQNGDSVVTSDAHPCCHDNADQLSNNCTSRSNSNGVDLKHRHKHFASKHQHQQQQSTSPATTTSTTTATSKCCNMPSNIERILMFGRDLHVMGERLKKEKGPSEENERALKDAFSLLAYSDPWNSPVGHQLHASQREVVCKSLNCAILEQLGQPSHPPLEIALSHASKCLKVMSKVNMASCAFTTVASILA